MLPERNQASSFQSSYCQHDVAAAWCMQDAALKLVHIQKLCHFITPPELNLYF